MAIVNGDETGNTLYGGAEADRLKGFGGDDTLKGGGGADFINGGNGIDTAFYSDSQAGVMVDLAQGTGRSGTAEGDTIFNVENIFGSAHDDDLIGDDGANRLNGSSGWDHILGSGGDDILEGADGNDRLGGGAGADLLIGGAGSDTADYMSSPEGVQVSLTLGLGLFGDAHFDTLIGIERLLGSAHADLLTGDSGRNNIQGNGGDDDLSGFGGDDVLVGHYGADILIGGTGGDTYYVDQADQIVEFGGEGIDRVYFISDYLMSSYVLVPGADIEYLGTHDPYGAIDLTGNANGNVVTGNTGNNVINGHDGNDELWGRAGQDAFLFDTPLNAAANVDRIGDFDPADDTIRLDDAIFSSNLGLGTISSGEFVIGTAAQDANDRIIYNSTSGAVLYDADGVGGNAAVRFAELSPGLALTYLDFYVV